MHTMVERWGDQLVSTGVSPSTLVLMDPVPPSSLADRVAALPDSAAWAMHDAVWSSSDEMLASSIANGTCIGVSNGSYKDHFGTATWTLTSWQHLDQHAYGCLIVPGDVQDQSSF